MRKTRKGKGKGLQTKPPLAEKKPPGALTKKHVIYLSDEASALLEQVRAKYPRIASKGAETDAAIKFWAAFALHFGLDANLKPLGGGDGEGSTGIGTPQIASGTHRELLSPKLAS